MREIGGFACNDAFVGDVILCLAARPFQNQWHVIDLVTNGKFLDLAADFLDHARYLTAEYRR